MFGRIDLIMAASQHRHRAAGEAGAVRGLIDAARQSRHDSEAGLAEFAGEQRGKLLTCAGRVARADDRERRPHQAGAGAADREQRRRVIKHREAGGIAGLAGRQQPHADPGAGGKFALGFSYADDPAGAGGAAAPCKFW